MQIGWGDKNTQTKKKVQIKKTNGLGNKCKSCFSRQQPVGPDRARMRESLPSQTTSWKYVEQTFCRCVPVCACATLYSPFPIDAHCVIARNPLVLLVVVVVVWWLIGWLVWCIWAVFGNKHILLIVLCLCLCWLVCGSV